MPTTRVLTTPSSHPPGQRGAACCLEGQHPAWTAAGLVPEALGRLAGAAVALVVWASR